MSIISYNEQNAPMGNVKITTAFVGRCRVCSAVIPKGTEAMYNKSLTGSKIWHEVCPKDAAGKDTVLTSLRDKLQAKKIEGGEVSADEIVATLAQVVDAKNLAKEARDIAAKTDLVAQHMIGANASLEAAVRELLKAKEKSIVLQDFKTGETKDLGLQHFAFEKLLRASTARDASGHRLNIWVSGPAGTGKTTAARNVAKALNLPFYFTGSIDTEYKLLGFMSATGALVSRPFRQAWEHGGVFLKDEIDGSHPSAVLALNAALANGICDFPDRSVERHPDFLCIAAANTWGQGATVEYVGRTRLDAASLDRFVQIHWPIDEDLEKATAPDLDWCTYVQAVRRRLANRGLQGVMITPRATYFGAALLATGLDRETVVQMTLKKGLSDENWSQIK